MDARTIVREMNALEDECEIIYANGIRVGCSNDDYATIDGLRDCTAAPAPFGFMFNLGASACGGGLRSFSITNGSVVRKEFRSVFSWSVPVNESTGRWAENFSDRIRVATARLFFYDEKGRRRYIRADEIHELEAGDFDCRPMTEVGTGFALFRFDGQDCTDDDNNVRSEVTPAWALGQYADPLVWTAVFQVETDPKSGVFTEAPIVAAGDRVYLEMDLVGDSLIPSTNPFIPGEMPEELEQPAEPLLPGGAAIKIKPIF